MFDEELAAIKESPLTSIFLLTLVAALVLRKLLQLQASLQPKGKSE